MTKEEKMCFEYGRTFNTMLVPEGYAVACCFDDRMHHMVSEARSERGSKRNLRNMAAWYAGRAAAMKGGAI